MSSFSVFSHIPVADPNTGAKPFSDFKRDSHRDKVFLAGKEYVGEGGRSALLPLIRKIKQQMNSDPTLNPEYLPSLGLPHFTRRASELALGKDSRAIVENRVIGVQAVGGSGAVRLGAELLKCRYGDGSSWRGPVLLPSPFDESLSWIFKAAGVGDVHCYRYWDGEHRGVCVGKMMEDLEKAPEQSVVVLSVVGHWPTGSDLSQGEWKHVVEVLGTRRLLPFFLLRAQGLCSGEPEEDAWPLRYAVAQGLELLCAQSFSHNFGLYGERVGHLLCVLKENDNLLAVQSQAEKLVQALWAHPPLEGARVVTTVLSNPAHLVEWLDGLKGIAERCMVMRERLREKLRLLGGTWEHLVKSRGLYCCIGLTVQQVAFLARKRHVYLLPEGCLNVSAINSRNLDYVAESIHLALTSHI
ncbi:hypothetical protein P4O66_017340 [Electrophorus voltai]|uniref:aspartate transaminase n=1 Tax=Electrophorus voltai TaxID=2609070 RepID=A0AAD9DN43_9TELE|nr:hypothetical protein P4O66_017340 [Electrophorus voltai]